MIELADKITRDTGRSIHIQKVQFGKLDALNTKWVDAAEIGN